MKNTLLIALCSVSSLFAAELPPEKLSPVEDHFGYVGVGIGTFLCCDELYPLGSLAIGHRSQWGHHGFEASLHGNTFILWFSQVKLDLLYHYYFKPNLASQIYLGAGMGPGVNIEASSYFSSGDVWFSLSSAVAAGYEYRTKSDRPRFIDAQLSIPVTRALYGGRPDVVLSYGFGF